MKRLLLLVMLLLVPAAATAADKPYLAGRMLVASEKLSDPFFRQAVVFILEHDADGAVGLIVNRKVGSGSFRELLGEIGGGLADRLAEDRQVDLYFGGPVAPRNLFVLHEGGYDGPETVKSPAGIAMTGETAIIRAIAEGKGPARYRFVSGYAGWSAGQLEGEIEQGDWLDAPADPILIFESTGDTEAQWKRALEKAGLTL